LAYVPGDVALWPNLTGGETIDLLGRLHGGLDEQRLSELLDRFELDPTRKGRAYSKGNRQKVVLVTALASNAELLLLDEPTSGLDPLMEEVFRDCLEAERDRGRTVLFSSHLLAEVERLCDHVTIIRAGRAVESGAMEDLRHLAATTIRAEFREEPREPYSLGAAYDVVVDGRTLSCRVDPDGYDELLARLANMGVRRLQANPPTLEEIFLGFYSGPTPDVT
jgi:ABC-2 type transport system ATP-binding protein